MPKRPLLPVLALVGAFAAGVGATALYLGSSRTAADAAPPQRASGEPIAGPGLSPRPTDIPRVRGTLPPLGEGAANASVPASFEPMPEDPRLQALESQVARLSALIEQQQGRAGAPPISADPSAAPRQPLYPEPYIVPGTENRPGGPIMAAFGPPPPYNTGSRAPDPPAVPGGGCGTCESGAAAQR